MPREARKKSESGIYHIILRGINRQNVFEDDKDRQRLIQTLAHYKDICEYSIYAYCLMDNHFHLSLKVGKEPLEQIMRRICGSYVFWYNQKYQRIGNLFQDRFKSEPIEDDKYFLTVLRYIHQNPIKANLVKDISEYQWSSYNDYIFNKGFIDREFVLRIFNEDEANAIKAFDKFTKKINDDVCLEVEDKQRKLTDRELIELIENMIKIKVINIQNQPKELRNKLLKEILRINDVSTRQLARVTGVSINVIWKL